MIAEWMAEPEAQITCLYQQNICDKLLLVMDFKDSRYCFFYFNLSYCAAAACISYINPDILYVSYNMTP